jgi:fructose-1,6-bisphosphatase I
LVKTVNNEKVGMYLLNTCGMFDYVRGVTKPSGNMIYSINMSYEYEKDIHYFLNKMKKDGCTQRWCGAIVADAHQVLMRGGTFIYPGSSNKPQGKIRYLYEALPISYLFTVLDCTAVDINIKNQIDRIPYVKLANGSVHGETPIILSTHYSRKELKSIFEINDLIKC